MKKIINSILIIFAFIHGGIGYSKNCFNSCEKITFVYIHGVYEIDEKVFNKEVAGMHKHFENKRLGQYVIAPEYKKVYWGQLPLKGTCYELYKSGLIGMNMDHNFWKVKKTTEPKISLLINPIYKFFLVGDMGSRSSSVFFRNLVNNYIYQIIWVIGDIQTRTQIFNLMESQISQIDGKYVIVGHSLGSAISTKFIEERVMLTQNESGYNSKVSNNFLGLITGGDINNTFLSLKFARDLKMMKKT